MSRAAILGLTLVGMLVAAAGCTRKHYRRSADRESYALLRDKTGGRPWEPLHGFSILPDRSSRFYDPTPIEDPELPLPAPQLYAFQLPELPERDPKRFRPNTGENDNSSFVEEPFEIIETPHEPLTQFSEPIRLLAHSGRPSLGQPTEISADQVATKSRLMGRGAGEIQLAAFMFQQNGGGYGNGPASQKAQPIPKHVWDSVPDRCLKRMFEFASVRKEYEDTYKREPAASLRDDSPRLALEDIVKLALINSRSYQTQKETLYSAALALSFQRFQYQCKFTPMGNGSVVDYVHNRTADVTVNTLGVNTQYSVDKILATGGTLLSRFANNILLTFNGPQGFAADINSELLLEVSQSVFQRDTVFESLTQAERNVVYAARDFARFRKTFFTSFTSQYYPLINTYRNIEIATQNYFSNQRAYAQYEAEFRSGKQGKTRVQLDQLEQSFINSRRNLIQTCNQLESDLDALKLQIGIPPETPVNLDLTELRQLTLGDEITVGAQSVRRSRRELQLEREKRSPEQSTLLNFSIKLMDRMVHWMKLREKVGETVGDLPKYAGQLPALRVDEAKLAAAFFRANYEFERKKLKPVALYLFNRTTDLADSLHKLAERQLDLAKHRKKSVADLTKRWTASMDALNQVKRLDQRAANAVLREAESITKTLAERLGQTLAPPTPANTLKLADRLLKATDPQNRKALSEESGLTRIEIEMDAAMMTALTQRYDLMNVRGAHADEWRRIKVAADDLKSILNLRATQVVRTDSRHNRPFDFTFKDSETRLRLEFDAPLNRKAQRNAYRLAIINYQAALRDRIDLEDSIKVDIRNDLRTLDLRREQYRIAVAAAALAFERVDSTLKQLELGKGSTARDFVEAQQAYAAAVSDVANQHINYIQDRISLFLDMELLNVDAEGFWPELYNENHQPTPCMVMPPIPPYGTLPPGVCYSHRVKRMLGIPPGKPMIFSLEEETMEELDAPVEQLPIQPTPVQPTPQKPPEVLPPPRAPEEIPTQPQVLQPLRARVAPRPAALGIPR